MPSARSPSRIIVLRIFLKTRTIRLKFWFVAWCLAVQFLECCFGKFYIRDPFA
jgi:hypothetical protein